MKWGAQGRYFGEIIMRDENSADTELTPCFSGSDAYVSKHCAEAYD